MIRAVMTRRPDGRLTGYELKGHSGYAEAGSDIVCAAASALAVNCANSLETVCKISPAVTGGEDGFLRVELPDMLTGGEAHDAQVLLSALRQGLSDLAEEYPTYIRFSIKERREST